MRFSVARRPTKWFRSWVYSLQDEALANKSGSICIPHYFSATSVFSSVCLLSTYCRRLRRLLRRCDRVVSPLLTLPSALSLSPSRVLRLPPSNDVPLFVFQSPHFL